MIDFNKIAEVLETMAVYVDDVEWKKTATERKAHDKKIDQIAERYVNKTGEALNDSSREKLSKLDGDALSDILKIGAVANGDGTLESLGGPADGVDTSGKSHSVKEAAAQADDKFLNWIIS